jgi:hypothetical protein
VSYDPVLRRATFVGYFEGTWQVEENVLLADANDLGHVVGTDMNRRPDGTYAGFISGPGFRQTIHPAGAAQTSPEAVNNRRTVIGSYVTTQGTLHNFVWSNGKSVNVRYPGALWTSIGGITDAGIIVGSYAIDSAAGSRGFFGIPRSPVNVRINSSNEPVAIDRTQPLRIDLSFVAPPSGALNAAELYVGVATSRGVWWLNSSGALVATPTRTYAGALAGFDAIPLIDVPSAAAFPPDTYTWFMVVDDDSNGAPNGVFYDLTQVTIR